jgi:plasmid stabilization system protein ParE
MPPVKWSGRALSDIERLYAFLAKQSLEAATRAIKTIRQSVRVLGKQPEIGRSVEALPPGFREWIVEFGSGAYVVLYLYNGVEVVILAVRHGREAGY